MLPTVQVVLLTSKVAATSEGVAANNEDATDNSDGTLLTEDVLWRSR